MYLALAKEGAKYVLSPCARARMNRATYIHCPSQHEQGQVYSCWPLRKGQHEQLGPVSPRRRHHVLRPCEEGRCKATWKREFKLPWREAGPPNHLDDKVDSDQ